MIYEERELKVDPRDKKNKNIEYVVGLDITDSYTQVSVGNTMNEEVTTVTVSPDGDSYLIPTALFKRKEVNQWFAGKDAVKYRDTDGYFVDRLIEKARNAEEIIVGAERLRPSSLLALFMKRALALAYTQAPADNIGCIMITVDSLDKNLIQMLSEAVLSLGIKTKDIYFQSHMESFYNYVLFQPAELWNRDVFLYDATGERMKAFRLERNRNTTPVVAFIDTYEEEKLSKDIYGTADASSLFSGFVSNTTEGHMYSSAYLVGDEFAGDWGRDGINLLCRKGRVFQGNNLFSKGAAYSARNRIAPTEISRAHAFLGNDKLRSNVGINALDRGENAYIPLLDGGINWFDAKRECELILPQGNKLTFLVTPLTGKNPEMVDITLGDIPKRPPKTTRLRVSVKMQSETKMLVNIKDLGFGEIFPAASIEWNEVISV